MKNLRQIDYCKKFGALANFDAGACARCAHFSALGGNCPGIGSRVEFTDRGVAFRICLAVTLLGSSILAGHCDQVRIIPGLGGLASGMSKFLSPGGPMIGLVISAALAMAAAGLCVQTGMTTLTTMAGYGKPGMNRA